MAETVTFKGIRYRRYPESGNWSERAYFVPGIADRTKHRLGRLHEEIWKEHNGPIPPGSHIHHEDHDPLNNDPGNLVCLDGDEHKRYHAALADHATPRQLAHLERVRPLTVAWHRSDEGREWHRQHAVEVAAQRQLATFNCKQCAKPYETVNRGDGTRFCSNRCKSAWRRAAGLDDEQRNCAYCGCQYTTNRYEKGTHCSRSCAAKNWRSRKAAGLRSDS